uniref:UPAR/Ly6 domain-containing protein n=1 Tax=Leptobrachium leishanense TaxID=445787 RepID=A0A8C5R0B3_9ANUR
TCEYGTCTMWSKLTCAASDTCITYMSSTSGLTFMKKGCHSHDTCNKNSSFTYLGLPVKIIPSCCNTNLCNSMLAPQVSAVTGIAAMVALCLQKLLS